MYNIHKIIG